MAAGTIMLTFPGARILQHTPDILRSLLTNAATDDLDWQPSPDRWSINMVLAHLADVELKGLSRFRAIVERDNPLLPAYDQLELFRSGRKFDGHAELSIFEHERRDTLAWLDSLPASVGVSHRTARRAWRS